MGPKPNHDSLWLWASWEAAAKVLVGAVAISSSVSKVSGLVVYRINAFQAVGIMALVSHLLLARSIPQFLATWSSLQDSHPSSLSSSVWAREESHGEHLSKTEVRVSCCCCQKWLPIILAIFYQSEASHMIQSSLRGEDHTECEYWEVEITGSHFRGCQLEFNITKNRHIMKK